MGCWTNMMHPCIKFYLDTNIYRISSSNVELESTYCNRPEKLGARSSEF